MAVNRFCIRSYPQDLRIFPSPSAKISLAVLLLFLLGLPLFAGKYIVFVAAVCGVSVIGALGLNILTGYTGLISLGHAAFMGIGAYTAAALANKAGFPFLAALPLAGLMAAASGALVGIPTLRLRGLYLVVTTLAFEFIVEHIIYHWESVTQSDRGISLPSPDLFGYALDSYESFYYVILLLAVVTAVFTKNLAMSRTGRALVAIRDRDIAAEIIGVHLASYKIMAFVVSSFIAGVAGALYAYLLGLIGPDHFTFNQSVLYIAMIIVGGMGTVMGSIIGAVFMVLLPEVINAVSGPIASAYPILSPRIGAISVIVYGSVIIFFLLFEPDGLFGIWLRIKRYWKPWPFTY
ncbi:MAG: branched-chain amino acid ABC transporter permease [Desulfobacterales bacterium]|nr:MAG: branched-chain amino acid ABC transporter permease [Desulfobacterales bacterium]